MCVRDRIASDWGAMEPWQHNFFRQRNTEGLRVTNPTQCHSNFVHLDRPRLRRPCTLFLGARVGWARFIAERDLFSQNRARAKQNAISSPKLFLSRRNREGERERTSMTGETNCARLGWLCFIFERYLPSQSSTELERRSYRTRLILHSSFFFERKTLRELKVARNEVENASFAQLSAHRDSRIWRPELIEPAAERKRRARGRRPTFKSAYPDPQILPQCNISSNYPYNVWFFWVSRVSSQQTIILAKKMKTFSGWFWEISGNVLKLELLKMLTDHKNTSVFFQAVSGMFSWSFSYRWTQYQWEKNC